jgi:hypothetical protein
MDVPLLFRLVGTELVFTGIFMFSVAINLLGKSESKTAGFIASFAGSVTLLLGWYELFVLGETFAGTLGLIFGTAQVSAGIHTYHGLSFKGLGWYSVFGAIALWFYTYQWFTQGLPIWGFFGATWALIFVVFIPVSLKPTPLNAKICAYWLIFCSFVSLFIPGLFLMANLYGFV